MHRINTTHPELTAQAIEKLYQLKIGSDQVNWTAFVQLLTTDAQLFLPQATTPSAQKKD